MLEIMFQGMLWMLIAVGVKSVIGYRFPWEACHCCGKKMKEREC